MYVAKRRLGFEKDDIKKDDSCIIN
jgi:hypothetical protein